MKKLLLVLLIIPIILISGCTSPGESPPLIKESPAQMPLTLTAYGELTDYSIDDDITTVKIQTDIVNCEINNTQLNIQTKTLQKFGQTVEFLTCLNLEVQNQVQPSLAEFLETNNIPDEDITACENQIIQDLENKYPECKEVFVIDNTELDHNIHEFNLACNIIHNLQSENKYAFAFMKLDKESEFWSMGLSDELESYKNNCKMSHDKDLSRDQMLEIIEPPEGYSGAEIIEEVITVGEPKTLQIKLINNQDNSIEYKINHAEIIGGEFITDETIETCQVTFDDTIKTISSLSEEIIEFTVNCEEPIEREITYESCDIHNENCQTVTHDNNFYLFGEYEFTDELGNLHILSNHKFKQFISIE